MRHTCSQPTACEMDFQPPPFISRRPTELPCVFIWALGGSQDAAGARWACGCWPPTWQGTERVFTVTSQPGTAPRARGTALSWPSPLWMAPFTGEGGCDPEPEGDHGTTGLWVHFTSQTSTATRSETGLSSLTK